MNRVDRFFVYAVECRDGSYYVGSTSRLANRIKAYNSGHGSTYLKAKLPVKWVCEREYRYYKNALHAERNLKKLTRKQKDAKIGIYEKNKSL